MESLDKMKKRIVEIAYRHKLSHLGSYFSCLPVIDEVLSYPVVMLLWLSMWL
jgi:hypothetical protein